MPRPKLTYKGVISDNEQMQLELDIRKYLGMSLIPKQHSNGESDFYVTVSSAGKADSNLYHAMLALEKLPFVGEFYFPMESSIFDLETGLKKQLSELTDDIRTIETSLMVSKEAYLKVQGALEILDILRKKVKEDDATLKAALSDIGAD